MTNRPHSAPINRLAAMAASLLLTACAGSDPDAGKTGNAAATAAAGNTVAGNDNLFPKPADLTRLTGNRVDAHNGRFKGRIGLYALDVPVICADINEARGTANIRSEDSLHARLVDNNGDGIALSLQGFAHRLSVEVLLPNNDHYTFVTGNDLQIDRHGLSYADVFEHDRDDGSHARYSVDFAIDCNGG